MATIYELVDEYKKKYPNTIAFRVKKHAKVIEGYLNPGETVIYAFCAQKNDKWYDILSSCVVALTNKRILIGQKRVLWGSFYTQITPEMYNDMEVYRGLFFGKITIDTIKEVLILTDLDKSSLQEIETQISEYMIKKKRKHKENEN